MTGVRTVDLALYSDELALKAAGVAAHLERARNALRQAAIEREVRTSLDPATLRRLERLGALDGADARALRSEVVELAADLAALRDLQAWTDARLAEARGAPAADRRAASSFGDELGATRHGPALGAERARS